MRDTITLIGNIGTAPDLQTSDDGRPFLNFRLVTNHSWQNKETHEFVDGDPNWFTVKAFRTLAVNASASLEKGQRVIVSGRLSVRNWVSGEKSGTQVEVMADHIGHDLSLGTAKFARMHASDGGRAGTTSDGGAPTGEADSGPSFGTSSFASGPGDRQIPDLSAQEEADDDAGDAESEHAAGRPAGAQSPF